MITAIVCSIILWLMLSVASAASDRMYNDVKGANFRNPIARFFGTFFGVCATFFFFLSVGLLIFMVVVALF